MEIAIWKELIVKKQKWEINLFQKQFYAQNH